jgi:hypothetical protein
MYEDGRIDLGYMNDVFMLNPEVGERLELECKVVGWRDWVAGVFHGVLWGNSEET